VPASTLLMAGLTALMGVDALDLPPGSTVAVTGAAGGIGGHAIQLANAAGLTVIADAADKDRVLVASLGADHVLSRGDGFPTESASCSRTARTGSSTPGR
jgi:NADPH2:quinone reductase